MIEHFVRLGKVSDVDVDNKLVRVRFSDLKITSGWLGVIKTSSDWLPQIDDKVLCLFLPIFNGDGFVLGVIQ